MVHNHGLFQRLCHRSQSGDASQTRRGKTSSTQVAKGPNQRWGCKRSGGDRRERTVIDSGPIKGCWLLACWVRRRPSRRRLNIYHLRAPGLGYRAVLLPILYSLLNSLRGGLAIRTPYPVSTIIQKPSCRVLLRKATQSWRRRCA